MEPGSPSATAWEQGKGSDDEKVKMKPTYSHQDDDKRNDKCSATVGFNSQNK